MSENKPGKMFITGQEIEQVSLLFPPTTRIEDIIKWLNGIGPMPEVSPEGYTRIKILSDCITLGKDSLRNDPTGQVIWVQVENHAYFIPSTAQDTDEAAGLLKTVEVDGKEFKVQPWTVGQLRDHVKTQKAEDITALLKL